MDEAAAGAGRRGGKMRRQLSGRIQMHAPSSIRIAPASAHLAQWNAAIPLLSPLDIVSIIPPDRALPDPATAAPPETVVEQDREAAAGRWKAWQHPAEPFHYEPPPGNAPVAFLQSHCA